MTKREMLKMVERRRRYYKLTREQVVFAVKLYGRTKRYQRRSHAQRMMATTAFKKWLANPFKKEA